MLAIEVEINGKRRCRAGLAGDGVVSAILSWVTKCGLPRDDGVRFQVGGLDSVHGEHMNWLVRDLAVGDEVLIRVVDAPKATAPIKESRRPVDSSPRREKAYVRRMAKKFGWKIVTK